MTTKELISKWKEYKEWCKEWDQEKITMDMHLFKGDFDGFILWLEDRDGRIEQ